jgi:nicotinamidase-related amidase
MNQLSMKGRKIVNRAKKMKFWGGMQYIEENDRGDLIKIWDTFCKKRVVESGNFGTLKEPVDTTVKPYALFVIDMQNDFIDRDYDRVYMKKAQPEEVNFVDPFTKSGNFDVAQGVRMIKPLLEKLENAIKDGNCKYIIFSRDYHPPGHKSFNIQMSNNTYGGDANGCFPAHCIQKHNGSSLIREIEDFITTNQTDNKIKVIFKGIDPNVDSFTAVPMDEIDHIASNHKADSQVLCIECGEGKTPCCSSVTGGFYIKDQTAVEAMGYMDVVNSENSIQAKYNDDFIDLKDIAKIEVCGLAGDYCVRDTIVALAKKFNDKEIVLLNYLTRYAFLPLFTIRTIPEHKAVYEKAFTPDTVGNISEDIINKYIKTNDNDLNRFEKDIKYYVFDCPIKGTPRLMKKEELENITQADFIFFPALEDKTNTLPVTRKHFITGHEEILSDYENTNKNINAKIRIQWMPNENKKNDITPSVDLEKLAADFDKNKE